MKGQTGTDKLTLAQLLRLTRACIMYVSISTSAPICFYLSAGPFAE